MRGSGLEPEPGAARLGPADIPLDHDELVALGERVARMIADHLCSLPERPVFRPVPREVAARAEHEPPPMEGRAAAEVLEEFASWIEPYPFGNGHPRFWGWVNSPPTPIAIFGAALAAAMNPSVAGGNHAAVWVERQVTRWLATVLGFPPSAKGILTNGGSTATLTALTVARHRATDGRVRTKGLREGPGLTLYTSEEGHGCIRKSAELLGLGSDQVRILPTDEAFRMDVAALESAIRADVEAGLTPMAVVASAGTVNTGAIDPLEAIADVCRRWGVWLHVDGAYGAPAILTEAHRRELEPIGLADSVALDPHKWLYIPVEAGLVVVRDAESMRAASSLVPPYLQTDGNLDGVGGPPWFSEYGFQQTRDFRALRVWMALKHHGLSGYARAIEHDLSMARHLADRVDDREDLELLAAGLSIVCFRYRPAGLADSELDGLNQAILERLQLGGEAFITGTTLRGRFALRACFVNFRTATDDIDHLVDVVSSLGVALLRRSG